MISTFSPRFRAFLPLLSLLTATTGGLWLAGCQKSGSQPVVLAQVDQATLTLDELRDIFPAEYEEVLPREQYLDVIQRWIDDEAVHQQALKRKLDQDPQMQRKLARLRRRMLIEEFLAREIGGNSGVEPDEGAMTRYYENNKSDFLRKNPEYRYLHLRVSTLKEALDLRSKVRGDNFATLADKSSLDGTSGTTGGDGDNEGNEGGLVETPFRKTSEIPLCLQDVLDKRAGWLSNPISCPDGVYLVKLLDRIEAGTPLPFPQVRSAIAARLSMQHQERMRESKIRQYKEGVAISLNIDQIPGQEGPDAPSPDAAEAAEERLPPGE